MIRDDEEEAEINEGGEPEGDLDEQDELEEGEEDEESDEDAGREQDEGDDDEGDQSIETRARAMGWKPKEQHKGKGEFIDAAEFVRRAEEETPAMRKALRNMERKIHKMEKNTDAIIAHQQREVDAAEQRGYRNAMAEVNGRLEQAIEDGDVEAHRQAMKDRDKIQEEHHKKVQNGKGGNGAEDPAVTAWRKENPWFDSDPMAAAAAIQVADHAAKQGKNTQEQLEAAENYVRRRFPDLFEDEDDGEQRSRRTEQRKQRKAPYMPGKSNGTNRGGKPKDPYSYENLRKDAKVECDRFVREMVSRGKKEKDARDAWMSAATQEMFNK